MKTVLTIVFISVIILFGVSLLPKSDYRIVRKDGLKSVAIVADIDYFTQHVIVDKNRQGHKVIVFFNKQGEFIIRIPLDIHYNMSGIGKDTHNALKALRERYDVFDRRIVLEFADIAKIKYRVGIDGQDALDAFEFYEVEDQLDYIKKHIHVEAY